MDRKGRVHDLVKQIAEEVLQAIKEQESKFSERWVPAAQIKNDLELYFAAVPKGNKQYGEKSWLFGIVARLLEDENRLEYKKVGRRAYCRTM